MRKEKIIKKVMNHFATNKFKNAPVLFKIVTIDAPIEINGKPDVIKGGQTYEVIEFEKDKYYITNNEYKPGVPQLIPWSMAKKI